MHGHTSTHVQKCIRSIYSTPVNTIVRFLPPWQWQTSRNLMYPVYHDVLRIARVADFRRHARSNRTTKQKKGPFLNGNAHIKSRDSYRDRGGELVAMTMTNRGNSEDPLSFPSTTPRPCVSELPLYPYSRCEPAFIRCTWSLPYPYQYHQHATHMVADNAGERIKCCQ
jgi:hypothetical protein